MEYNLRSLNLFVGLLKNDPRLPSDLHVLGYTCAGIEWEFDNGAGGLVNPELIAPSVPQEHTLVFEWKSGGNIDLAQAERYHQVTSETLVANANLLSSEAATHDIVYMVPSDVAEKAASALSDNGYDFCLLASDTSCIRLTSGQLVPEATHEVFARPLEIDWEEAPVGYVPCWLDSPLSEVAEVAVPSLLVAMRNSERHLPAATAARHVFSEVWESLPSRFRTQMIRKVRSAFDKGCKGELHDFIASENVGGDTRYAIKQNPFRLYGRERTDSLRRLRSAQRAFLAALREEEASARQLRFDIDT